ncbi:MAG: hypothetical protein H6R04_276 [Burkholderiaceae bacterium]|nr:hypothetical protein [Burkholderiaceae bacterium]
MKRNFKLLLAFVLSALCVATAFAYTGGRQYREQQPMRQRPAPVARDVQGARGQAVRPMRAEPYPAQMQPQSGRRFTLPQGGGYERNGKVYPQPYAGPGAQPAPVMRRPGRLSPEQRSTLRRQINEANRVMPYPPR